MSVYQRLTNRLHAVEAKYNAAHELSFTTNTLSSYHFSFKRIITSGVWLVGTDRRAVRLDVGR